MTNSILRFIASNGYVAVFILMLFESACIPIPSEVTMLVGGALADATFVHQVGGHPLNVWVVGVVGAVANLVGSWLAWGIGHRGGRPLIERWGRYIRLNTKHLDKAEEWFAKYGTASVFVSRLLPVLRTFISLPAGIAKMPFWRFTIYTIVGCLPWTIGLALIGQALGSQWDKAEHAMKPLTYVVAVAIVGVAIWFIVKRRRQSATQA